MKTLKKTGALAGAFLLASGTASAALVLNEIRTDQPNFPDDEEFIEIKGDPGESLDDVWFLYIGDHSGEGSFKGSGVVEIAIDLSGESIPDDGHFLIVGPNFNGDAFGLSFADIDMIFGGLGTVLENSDNVTPMLVRGFTGGPIGGQPDQLGEDAVDIDDNDDGVPNETLPWTEVVDAVGLVDSRSGGEFFYGEALGFVDIGPNAGGFVPAHAYRTDDTEEWLIGEFDLFEIDADGTIIGLNPNAADTPGAQNPNASTEPFIEAVSTIFLAPGDTFTVEGSNLDTVSEVTVGGVSVSFTVVDGTTLDVTIPQTGISSGPVTVTNPDGSATSVNHLVLTSPEDLILQADFGDGLGDFTTFSVASDANWEAGTFFDAASIQINGFGADEASDDWLISPAIDLEGVSDPFLLMGHERVFEGPALEVQVSTDYDGGGNPSGATWTPLSVPLAPDEAEEIIDSGEVDLSDYSGETVYIAIRYTSDGPGQGEGAIDRIHYFAIGGQTLGWKDDPNLGWIFLFTEDWASSPTFGFINIANFPWVYQINFGYMIHVIRAPEVAIWLYNTELGFIFAGEGNGGFFQAQNKDWAADNFINPVD